MKPILATLLGIPAAIIVVTAADVSSAPLVGDGALALVALWILGSAMCAFGISAMRERFGFARTNLVGMPLGIVATTLVVSGLLGWPALLSPIANALGGQGTDALTRAAIVGVGLVMLVKWMIAWMSYLPRPSRAAS